MLNLPRKETDMCIQVFLSITGSRMLHENGTIKQVLSIETMLKKELHRLKSDEAPSGRPYCHSVRSSNKCRDTASQITCPRFIYTH